MLDLVTKIVDATLNISPDDDQHFDSNRGLAVGIIVGVPLCAFYASFYWFIGFFIGSYVTLALITSLLMALYALRLRVPGYVVINLLNFFISVGMTYIAIYSGGLFSTAVPWLIAPVLFAFWVYGPQLGLFWCVTSAFIVIGLYVVEALGVFSVNMVPVTYLKLAQALSASGFLMFSWAMTWTFYWRLNHALNIRDSFLRDRQQMVQTMAHDLKNPIAGMVSRIYLMERRRQIGDKIDPDDILENIKKDASKVLEHVDRLLLLNRSQTVRKAPVIQNCDVRSVFEGAIRLHQQWMDAKSIQIDASQIIATQVKADPELLLRLLENILSNAIKYSHPQSYIRCLVRDDADDKKQVVIEVKDHGIGMDPREAEHFFKLKYRPNRPTAGESSSGVGASLMHEITEVMGGKIWLRSQGKDQGTTVSVQLERGGGNG